jgi:ubiquinone biosynthesis protein COQ9
MSQLPPSPLRDAAIEQLLPQVPEHGWTSRALPEAAMLDRALTRELFPSGAAGMVEAFCDLADRRMLEAASLLDPTLRPTQRLRAALALRLAQTRPHRAAVRRAAAVMALPGYGGLAARCTYRATLLFWLRDDSEDDAPTMAFFDRRVAGLRALGRWRARLTGKT